jgi:hypothetical protein
VSALYREGGMSRPEGIRFRVFGHQYGALYAEFSVVMPLLILFLFFLADIGKMLLSHQALSSLSREAVNALYRECVIPYDAAAGNYPALVASEPDYIRYNACSGPNASGCGAINFYSTLPASPLEACIFDKHLKLGSIGAATLNNFRLVISEYRCNRTAPGCTPKSALNTGGCDQANPLTCTCTCDSYPSSAEVIAATPGAASRFLGGAATPAINDILDRHGRLIISELSADYPLRLRFLMGTEAYETSWY